LAARCVLRSMGEAGEEGGVWRSGIYRESRRQTACVGVPGVRA
jgi:hypothetical protein